ncbi:hypothetical protein SISNIDRAFT_454292 [Sistotremastrum niveocremeum HHB9708]|uniref:CENP-V/GFA domain-containing protein n=1 Tax=Sistotremastrum niveocremeum HHB9708 TaxID=1314777 RepID=A0A164V624_9AGAM|nr:hypothetical protein SISNIDRAFT_454292 [Sistotremastrum niveocremeum HHB9708]
MIDPTKLIPAGVTGKFKYEFTHKSLEEYTPTVCNCSICSRKGYVFGFIPLKDFKWTSGDFDGLTEYLWKSKTVHHYFCPIDGCAIGSKIDGNKNIVALNLNCVDDLDTEKLPKNHYDGKSA